MKRNGFMLAMLTLALTFTAALVTGCVKQDSGGGAASGGGSVGGAVKNPRGAAPATDFSFDLTEDGAGVVITGYSGKGGKVVIPAAIEDVPVIEIRRRAFYENYDITELVVPDSVITIGDTAFAGMSSLTSVTLPDGWKEIPEYLFYDVVVDGNLNEFPCEKLTSVNLPAGLESVGNSAFSNAGELVNLTIPDSLTSIKFGRYVFQGCGKLPIKTRQRLKELGYTGSF
ncbi:MAG: leucine-rich repeat domain-containing protein [Treponema sp.]|nr:leucine-rich repeat domain-containing protein [Treponema sp.]